MQINDLNLPDPYLNPTILVNGYENNPNVPAFIYFALNKKDSLLRDPFNQPICAIAHQPIQILSFSVPFHDENTDPHQAMKQWASHLSDDISSFKQFINRLHATLNYMQEKHLIGDVLGVGGLSRGGFIASHLAAQNRFITTLLLFAPLTQLVHQETFQQLKQNAEAEALSLYHLAPNLVRKKVNCFISHCDQKVGSDHAWYFLQKIIEANLNQGVRQPPVYSRFYPPSGYQGHGTLPPYFQEGAQWLADNLLSKIKD